MKRQRGTTLLVVLVMLVVLTLLGIAGVRMSSSSLQVVGNMQARKFVENWGLQGNEFVMNSINPFNNPAQAITSSTSASGTDWFKIYGVPSGISITVTSRTCLFSAPASGYSAVSTIAPEDNLWEYGVTASDGFTGATTTMVQGTRIRQLFGACP